MGSGDLQLLWTFPALHLCDSVPAAQWTSPLPFRAGAARDAFIAVGQPSVFICAMLCILCIKRWIYTQDCCVYTHRTQLSHCSLQLHTPHLTLALFTAATHTAPNSRTVHCSYTHRTQLSHCSLQLHTPHLTHTLFTAATHTAPNSHTLHTPHLTRTLFTAATHTAPNSHILHTPHLTHTLFTAATHTAPNSHTQNEHSIG
uniref:Uncharacterized protein n=1 Tax=Mastacembelus armatus TaxID=205130 RepID=A0A7N8XKQ9_9TELE